MKRFNRIIIMSFVLFALIVAASNALLYFRETDSISKTYKIELNRAYHMIDDYEDSTGDIFQSEIAEENTDKSTDKLSDSSQILDKGSIVAIASLSRDSDGNKIAKFVNAADTSYVIYVTDKAYYRIEYKESLKSSAKIVVIVNSILIISYILVLLILIYIKRKILKPFNTMSELPFEISRGKLAMPLKESKGRYFGRFMWGMDLLRENLEDSKKKELELQKEKKTLLLSLSHDIKTPLSAIKLYSKALSKNLYKDNEKKLEIAEDINVKADEIEGYISEIIKASNEDFLNFEVDNEEIYTGTVLKYIYDYYKDKMELNRIDFLMEKFDNCLVIADKDRLTEVIQNTFENAIKYGDGRRISLSTEKDAESFIIKIENSGCNLPEREVAHIFDSFYRGSNIGKNPGSGLGLYICRQLMHLMEGEITAKIKDDLMIISIYLQMA